MFEEIRTPYFDTYCTNRYNLLAGDILRRSRYQMADCDILVELILSLRI